MQTYDIVKEAAALVENQIELLRALYLAKHAMDVGRSRLICRCGSCRCDREITLTWVETLMGQERTSQQATQAAPVAVAARTDAPLPSD